MVTTIYPIATDTAGCWYQRLHLPLTHLNPDEYRINWDGQPPYPPGSVVIAQRFAGDNPAWTDLCTRDDIRCVYDLDDDLIDVDPANTIPHQIYQPLRVGTIRNIEAAHVVTVSTPHLAAKISQWNPHVVVLPNCVHPARLDVPRPNRLTITVGWAGSMFHQQDFPPWTVAAIQAAYRTRPDIQWATIGADYLGVPNVHHPWGSMPGYFHHLMALDVGLAPLARTPFNRSKSWIKCLDYQAAGIVPIATRWGQYPDLIHDGVDGWLIDTRPGRLTDRIALLDWETITQMSTAARANAANWTIDKHAHKWAAVYRGEPA